MPRTTMHHDRRRTHIRSLAAIAIAASALIGGCAQRAVVNFEDAREYPLEAVQNETLNIQVFRNGTQIQLTNTSARTLPAGTLWINQWWFQEVPELAPGESLELGLRDFVDRYGQPFRAGGFFATRDPDLVVLAQWQTQDDLLGLVVVENRIN